MDFIAQPGLAPDERASNGDHVQRQHSGPFSQRYSADETKGSEADHPAPRLRTPDAQERVRFFAGGLEGFAATLALRLFSQVRRCLIAAAFAPALPPCCRKEKYFVVVFPPEIGVPLA